MATKQKKQDKASPISGKAQGTQAAIAAAPASGKIKDMIQYFEDAKTELGKVSWPTKKDVKATSIAVFILVVVMSLFLGLADLLLSRIMEAILSIGI